MNRWQQDSPVQRPFNLQQKASSVSIVRNNNLNYTLKQSGLHWGNYYFLCCLLEAVPKKFSFVEWHLQIALLFSCPGFKTYIFGCFCRHSKFIFGATPTKIVIVTDLNRQKSETPSWHNQSYLHGQIPAEASEKMCFIVILVNHPSNVSGCQAFKPAFSITLKQTIFSSYFSFLLFALFKSQTKGSFKKMLNHLKQR